MGTQQVIKLAETLITQGVKKARYVTPTCRVGTAEELGLKIEKLTEDVFVNTERSLYIKLFKESKSLKGKEFLNKIYDDLAKIMGYGKYKPKLNIFEEYKIGTSGPDKINVSLLAYHNKDSQIAVIRHELEHFRQNELIYRAFGRDKYINAKIDSIVNVLKLNKKLCIKLFNKAYKDLSVNEIVKVRAELYKNVEKKLELLDNILKEKGSISPLSKEYLEAEKYLEAMKEYVQPQSVLGSYCTNIEILKEINPKIYEFAKTIMQKYYDNPLEKEAILKGKQIKEIYKLFNENI